MNEFRCRALLRLCPGLCHVLLLLVLGQVAWAAAPAGEAKAAARFEEGVHYFELPFPVATADAGRVEVTELFSYGCPHCFSFEPHIRAWLPTLPGDVQFNRTPAVWNKSYEVYAQTYYTLEALGRLDQLHEMLFNAIHRDRRRLDSPTLMARLFSEHDVDPIEFARVYQSFGVRSSVQQAQARGRAYRATGVPTLIVNGKYRVQGNPVQMLKVAEYLIEQERQARRSDSS